MMTFKELDNFCSSIGAMVVSAPDRKGLAYVKLQKWTDGNKERYYTKEKNTLCKMKLKTVPNPVFAKYKDIKYNYKMTLAEKVKAMREIGLECKDDGTHHMPKAFFFDVTIEELTEAINKGMKWEAVRENKKLERMLNAL